MSDYFSACRLVKTRSLFTVDVSLAAPRQTMTVIVGASGSGKSTVLNLIAGLEQSDSSDTRITLDGADITRLPPGKRRVGMAFQSTALFGHLSVGDNVAYGLIARGMRKAAARKEARAFLSRFALGGYDNRFPHTLSGGEAQRAALARALIIRPRLVLFDEPLSALDAPLRKKLCDDIRSLQKEIGFTALWVTHDTAEAERIADRIVVMERGKIAEGSTEEGEPV